MMKIAKLNLYGSQSKTFDLTTKIEIGRKTEVFAKPETKARIGFIGLVHCILLLA